MTDNLGCKRICRQEGSFITCYSGRLIFNKTSLSGWYIGLIPRSLSPGVNLTLAFSHHILSAVSCSTNKRLSSLVKDDPFDLCRLHFITPPLFSSAGCHKPTCLCVFEFFGIVCLRCWSECHSILFVLIVCMALRETLRNKCQTNVSGSFSDTLYVFLLWITFVLSWLGPVCFDPLIKNHPAMSSDWLF